MRTLVFFGQAREEAHLVQLSSHSEVLECLKTLLDQPLHRKYVTFFLNTIYMRSDKSVFPQLMNFHINELFLRQELRIDFEERSNESRRENISKAQFAVFIVTPLKLRKNLIPRIYFKEISGLRD